MDLNYDAGDVANLDLLLDNQRSKIERLRERVKQLEFVPLEPGGTYNPVSLSPSTAACSTCVSTRSSSTSWTSPTPTATSS